MEFDDLSQQRIDYSVGPNGETVATITLTLQDGSEYTATESTTDEEVEELANAFAASEIRLRRQEIGRDLTEEEIAGFFSFIGKAVKAVGDVAKKVVTSKVFKSIGKVVAAAAPVLGPLAPAALAIGGGMMAASKLTSAAIAAKGGAKGTARALAKSAGRKLPAKLSASSKRGLLRLANRKRKSAERVARRVKLKRPPSKRRRIRRVPSVFAAAKAGRLRSHKSGNVKPRDLRKAMKAGRVFWLATRRAA